MIVGYRAARPSTVFAPLTAVLADRLSWRSTYLVLALILAAVTILALKAPWPKAASAPAHATDGAGQVARSRPFWMLATALTLSAFVLYAVVVALVSLLLLLLLLLERGSHRSSRLGPWLGRRRTDPRPYPVHRPRPPHRSNRPPRGTHRTWRCHHRRTRDRPRSVRSPAHAVRRRRDGPRQPHPAATTAIADRWGTTHYGSLSGLLAAPTTAAFALAPFVGAALLSPLGGYPAPFAALALLFDIAALIAARSAPTNTHIPER